MAWKGNALMAGGASTPQNRLMTPGREQLEDFHWLDFLAPGALSTYVDVHGIPPAA